MNISNDNIVVAAIVAMTSDRVIGKDGKLPWHFPEDMRRFSGLTRGHTVLMGRKTYESLPDRFRPLPDRLNVVATRDSSNKTYPPGVMPVNSPREFIERCRDNRQKLPSNRLWVIGGEEIYRETLPYWDEVELTLVLGSFPGDAYFPNFEDNFVLVGEEPHTKFKFQRYVRKSRT